MKKRIAIILFLIMCVLSSYSSVAARDPWNCPNPDCGRTGNTGNFCGNCGHAAPTPSVWNCVCGAEDNTGNYCPVCGQKRPVYDNSTYLAGYIPSGNGKSSTAFSVQSEGNARITLKQRSGKCIVQTLTEKKEKIYISWCGNVPPAIASSWILDGISEKEMCGRYHLRITEPNGNVYEREWNDKGSNMEYILSLPYQGVYRITVTPYSEKEINASWDNKQNISWVIYPEWQVAGSANCECFE